MRHKDSLSHFGFYTFTIILEGYRCHVIFSLQCNMHGRCFPRACCLKGIEYNIGKRTPQQLLISGNIKFLYSIPKYNFSGVTVQINGTSQ